MPHVERAVQTYLRFGELESFKAANESMWDNLSWGVVMLDKHCKILWTNRAGAMILSTQGGLRIDRGALTAVDRGGDRALQRLVQNALATAQGLPGGSGGPLAVPRPPPARPLSLLVAPIRLQAAFVNRPTVAIFINDPERRNQSAPELLRRLYGLTEREAAFVSLLLDGLDLRRAAERLGISVHTARTHLKFIFVKTGTHRQAELVYLLLRGPLGAVGGNLGS